MDRAESTLAQLETTRREALAALSQAGVMTSALVELLAELVPDDPAAVGDPAAVESRRHGEVTAFVEDYVRLLHHQCLATPRDALGRTPEEAVNSCPVLNEATRAHAKANSFRSYPAAPVALRHALRLLADARESDLETTINAPLWFTRYVRAALALLLLVLAVAEWIGMDMVARQLWRRPGHMQTAFSIALNLAMLACWYVCWAEVARKLPTLMLRIYCWLAQQQQWQLPVSASIDAENSRCRSYVALWSYRLLAREMEGHVAEGECPPARAIGIVTELLELDTTGQPTALPAKDVASAERWLALPLSEEAGTASSGASSATQQSLALRLEAAMHGTVRAVQTGVWRPAHGATTMRLTDATDREKDEEDTKDAKDDDEDEEDEEEGETSSEDSDTVHPPGRPVRLRFCLGTRVECCVARGWCAGTIIALYWEGHPYQILLDDNESPIFAPLDDDRYIRQLGAPSTLLLMVSSSSSTRGGEPQPSLSVKSFLSKRGWQLKRHPDFISVCDTKTPEQRVAEVREQASRTLYQVLRFLPQAPRRPRQPRPAHAQVTTAEHHAFESHFRQEKEEAARAEQARREERAAEERRWHEEQERQARGRADEALRSILSAHRDNVAALEAALEAGIARWKETASAEALEVARARKAALLVRRLTVALEQLGSAVDSSDANAIRTAEQAVRNFGAEVNEYTSMPAEARMMRDALDAAHAKLRDLAEAESRAAAEAARAAREAEEAERRRRAREERERVERERQAAAQAAAQAAVAQRETELRRLVGEHQLKPLDEWLKREVSFTRYD